MIDVAKNRTGTGKWIICMLAECCCVSTSYNTSAYNMGRYSYTCYLHVFYCVQIILYTPIQKEFSCLCNEKKFNYPCDFADLAVRVSGTIIQCRHTAYNNIMMQDA